MNDPPISIDPRSTAHQQPGLDLLRAVAIILVVVYHAGLFRFVLPWHGQRFGWIGVDLFFVLSGYLIAAQLFAPLVKARSLPLRTDRRSSLGWSVRF
jgi:peptidoglycan/LPS O-acetylase OafA/YrhL